MGNGVGRMIGIIAGAALCCIPGIGQIAGAVILLGTTTLGSGIDALVDNSKQNDAADKAAEEQRRRAAIEIERARVAAQRRAEEQSATARGNLAVEELESERRRQAAISERDRLSEIARAASAQLTFLEQSLAACRSGDFTTMPGLLTQMTDENFNVFADGALAACTTADALEECRAILEQEQMRREVTDNWRQEVAAVADRPAIYSRPQV